VQELQQLKVQAVPHQIHRSRDEHPDKEQEYQHG
jgi:hypothetical protein